MRSFSKCSAWRAVLGDGLITERDPVELTVQTRHLEQRKAAGICSDRQRAAGCRGGVWQGQHCGQGSGTAWDLLGRKGLSRGIMVRRCYRRRGLQVLYFPVEKKETMIICISLGCLSDCFLRIDPYRALTGSEMGTFLRSHQGALWKSGAQLTSEGFRALEHSQFTHENHISALCFAVLQSLMTLKSFSYICRIFVFACDCDVSSQVLSIFLCKS